MRIIDLVSLIDSFLIFETLILPDIRCELGTCFVAAGWTTKMCQKVIRLRCTIWCPPNFDLNTIIWFLDFPTKILTIVISCTSCPCLAVCPFKEGNSDVFRPWPFKLWECDYYQIFAILIIPFSVDLVICGLSDVGFFCHLLFRCVFFAKWEGC